MMLRISSSVLACQRPSKRARCPGWGRGGSDVCPARDAADEQNRMSTAESRRITSGRGSGSRYQHTYPDRAGSGPGQRRRGLSWRLEGGRRSRGHRRPLVGHHGHLGLPLTHHAQERARELGIELGPGATFHVGEGALLRPCLPVRTVGPQGGGGGAHRHEFAAWMTTPPVPELGIALAVEHDVMLVGDHGGQVECFLRLEDNARSLGGMLVHEGALFIGEAAGLGEYLEGDLYLADVVE